MAPRSNDENKPEFVECPVCDAPDASIEVTGHNQGSIDCPQCEQATYFEESSDD